LPTGLAFVALAIAVASKVHKPGPTGERA
jgi:hypothetical protein